MIHCVSSDRSLLAECALVLVSSALFVLENGLLAPNTNVDTPSALEDESEMNEHKSSEISPRSRSKPDYPGPPESPLASPNYSSSGSWAQIFPMEVVREDFDPKEVEEIRRVEKDLLEEVTCLYCRHPSKCS